jgi:hypothetical protein
MPETARWLGGFIRWLLKGCKTNLVDEMQGNLEATWVGSYDILKITSLVLLRQLF